MEGKHMAASTWTWFGGTDFSTILADWTLTPGGANGLPQPGDTVLVPGGTVEDGLGELAGQGHRAMALRLDVADAQTIAPAFDEIEAALGPISILVNCAGGDIAAKGGKPNPNDALNISLEDTMAVLNRNFIGTMLMCRAVVPGMMQRQRGAVINFGSLNGHVGVSPEVVYGCAKAAILHYTRCLALEMRPHGVRVNAISPGPTTTARFLATRETDLSKMDGVSLERYAKPVEIANAVAFLASDQSGFVNGQVLRVDGGMTLFAC